MKVDIHIERVELKLLAKALSELIFQNEIRQPNDEFEVKACASIDVVNISAKNSAQVKEILMTGDWFQNAIIEKADEQFSKDGLLVSGVDMPSPDEWDFSLSKAKNKDGRRSMGVTVNLYAT